MSDKYYGGRSEILTSLDPDKDILDILKSALPKHYENASQITYLYDMYKGKQDILGRVKEIRPEINNKVVDNVAHEITEFKLGYIAGEPIQYVKRGKQDDKETDLKAVTLLNDKMIDINRDPKDRQLIEWMLIAGIGHKFVITNKELLDEGEDFDFTIPDPRTAFVIKDSIRKTPVIGVMIGEGKTDQEKTLMAWTKNKVYTTIIAESSTEVPSMSGKPNPYGQIPLIEYEANPSRLGCFEPIIPIQNAINSLASNRVDDVEQIVQAIMVFINSEIDPEQFGELMAVGGVSIKGESGLPADVKMVGSKLDEQGSQIQVEHLYQRALTISGTPDRNASAGGNTGTSMEIGQGWITAENRARSFELMWVKSERLFLKLLINILKDLQGNDFDVLEVNDIDIKFTRNKLANMMVKSQAMLNLLQGGIHPKTAISTSMLFSDPEQVFMESEAGGYLEKWKFDPESVPTATGKSPPLSNARQRGLHSVQDNLNQNTDPKDPPKYEQVRKVGEYR